MSNYKNNSISRWKTVLISFSAHSYIMIIILITLIINGIDYEWHMLKDDGYYSIAGRYVQGDFSSPGIIGPALPAIYTVIYLFPENLHPFVRLLISQFFVLIILYSLSKITLGIFTEDVPNLVE